MNHGSSVESINFSNVICKNCLTEVSSSTASEVKQVILPYINEAATSPEYNLNHSLGSVLSCVANQYGYSVINVIDRDNTPVFYVLDESIGSIENTANDVYDVFNSFTECSSNESRIQKLINNINIEIREDYTDELIDRLRYLSEPTEDLYEGKMEYGSLAYFLMFLKTRNVLYPDIVLTPSGLIRAEWYLDNTHQFITEFLSDGYIRYVAINASAKNEDVILRNTGTMEFDTIKTTIRHYKTNAWCLSD